VLLRRFWRIAASETPLLTYCMCNTARSAAHFFLALRPNAKIHAWFVIL
jgi:hypothetical protein